jgi:hypothetical protein
MARRRLSRGPLLLLLAAVLPLLVVFWFILREPRFKLLWKFKIEDQFSYRITTTTFRPTGEPGIITGYTIANRTTAVDSSGAGTIVTQRAAVAWKSSSLDYDSLRDKEPPADVLAQGLAATLGRQDTMIMDPIGRIPFFDGRKPIPTDEIPAQLYPFFVPGPRFIEPDGTMIGYILLPNHPVRVGESWSVNVAELWKKRGIITYRLEGVRHNKAYISIEESIIYHGFPGNISETLTGNAVFSIERGTLLFLSELTTWKVGDLPTHTSSFECGAVDQEGNPLLGRDDR